MRLWVFHHVDLRSGLGHGASERADIQVNWGSTNNSKKAVVVVVTWNKGDVKPTVSVEFGEDVIPLVNHRNYEPKKECDCYEVHPAWNLRKEREED